ncbi:MAG: hypothetical protein ABI333_00370 [bacterium]
MDRSLNYGDLLNDVRLLDKCLTKRRLSLIEKPLLDVRHQKLHGRGLMTGAHRSSQWGRTPERRVITKLKMASGGSAQAESDLGVLHFE